MATTVREAIRELLQQTIAKHVLMLERDSLKAIAADQAAREEAGKE